MAEFLPSIFHHKNSAQRCTGHSKINSQAKYRKEAFFPSLASLVNISAEFPVPEM